MTEKRKILIISAINILEQALDALANIGLEREEIQDRLDKLVNEISKKHYKIIRAENGVVIDLAFIVKKAID